MFKLFRPFGVIVSLTTDKNVAVVTYASRKSAISARNCLHNFVLQPKPLQAPIPGTPAPPPPPDQPNGRVRITYAEWQRFVRTL